jgi:hypothetical protein
METSAEPIAGIKSVKARTADKRRSMLSEVDNTRGSRNTRYSPRAESVLVSI